MASHHQGKMQHVLDEILHPHQFYEVQKIIEDVQFGVLDPRNDSLLHNEHVKKLDTLDQVGEALLPHIS